MNYRHAYHAGNHTEIFKHAALVMLLEHLRLKAQPFMVLDTHSGLGVYNLDSEEAGKTGEREAGIDKVFHAAIPSADGYLKAVHEINRNGLSLYPGSPEIVRRFMRETDRLVACELHPTDYEILKSRYASDVRIKTLNTDGYAAIKSNLPPTERRGLVFVDPPFEDRNETEHMVRALANGMKKWATGIFCLWYPIKNLTISNALADACRAASYKNTLQAEFLIKKIDGETLAGSGLIICNTPWKIDDKLRSLCSDLKPILADGNGSWSVRWITEQS